VKMSELIRRLLRFSPCEMLLVVEAGNPEGSGRRMLEAIARRRTKNVRG
jgi:hypothetical protein